MQKTKNILFVISMLKSGGAERDVSRMTIDLAKRHNVYIFLFNSEIIDYEYGGELLAYDRLANTAGIGGMRHSFRKLLEIRKVKKEKKIDVSISMLEGPNILNVLSQVGEKTILRVLSYKSEVHRLAPKKWKKEALAMKAVYRFADMVVGNSRAICHDLVDNFMVPKSIASNIPNYYDLEYIRDHAERPLDGQYGFLNTCEYMVTSGRLSRPKGHFHLLDIFALVTQKRPAIKLVLLGRGEDHDELIRHAQGLGLHPWTALEDKPIQQDLHNVLFLDFQPNPFSYVSKSTLFIFTSLYEGFPNSLAEAMICGCPVISTDCLSGPREMIAPEVSETSVIDYPYGNGRGVLMPAFTPENAVMSYPVWAEEIERLLADADLRARMGKNAQKHMDKYSRDNIFAQWEKAIYE